MNISNCYNLQSIIRELEVAFQIDGPDFEERDMNVTIQNIKKRINRQYQVDLQEYKIDAVEQELGEGRGTASTFIDNVSRLHAKFSGYVQIVRYQSNCEVSMRNINYLGCTEETVIDLLVALQKRVTVPSAVHAVESIKDKVCTVNTCLEKRLIVLLIVSNAIGFDEMAATIAELLYLSMVV